MTEKKIIILDGCETCQEAKDNGMCKENECVESDSKLGQEIEKDVDITLYPECVVKGKDGKYVKCDITPTAKKYFDKV